MERAKATSSITTLTLAAAVLISLCGCGKSQEAKVLAAIEAKFPDGHRRCIGLGGLTGLKVGPAPGKALIYPSTGPTSPVEHAFVFYAARAGQPVPDLVADLARRGVLRLETVRATEYGETDANGNATALIAAHAAGRPPFTHRSSGMDVAIYLTAPYDDAFDFAVQADVQQPWPPRDSFPSRLYQDMPIPESAGHVWVPTVQPYALSVVTAACLRETPGRVIAVRPDEGSYGGRSLEADVEFEQHPPAWMTTDAFRQAALRPDTVWIDKPRRATVILTMNGEELAYAREKGAF